MILQFGDKSFERHVLRHRKHMRPGRHDVAHHLIAKLHCGADQVAVTFFDDSFFFPGLDQGLNGRLAGVFLKFALPRFGQRCNGKQKRQQKGDGQSQIKEHPDDSRQTHDP